MASICAGANIDVNSMDIKIDEKEVGKIKKEEHNKHSWDDLQHNFECHGGTEKFAPK